MKMNKTIKTMRVILIISLLALMLVGCNSNGTKQTDDGNDVSANSDKPEKTGGYAYEGALVLKGLAEDFEVRFNDIFNMEAVTREVKHISSSGEETVDIVKGVLLDTLLSEKGESQKKYSSIRFKAADGYGVTVPSDIISSEDIILAYEFNGEGLDEKKQPLRVAINNVRSMYYVSNLTEIEFSNTTETVNKSAQSIVMLETAISKMTSEDFMYYESNDKAVKVSDLLASYDTNVSEVFFVASDGYEKHESMDVVVSGFIKHTGEDAPLFTGLDLPKGMNVKSIMKMDIGTTSFVSVNSCNSTLEHITIDGDEGVMLSELVKSAGIDSDKYILTADDGYSVEVTKESLKDAVAYVNSSSTVTVKFDTQYPKNTKVKSLLSISVAGESVAADKAESETKTVTENEAEKASEAWTITVEGLSDGTFDFTSDKAERKLTKVALHTERMKNDEKKPEDWQGYKVLDLLSFLHVDNFNSLIIVAGDGYEYEIMKDQVDDETILAVVKDGEPMTGDNKVQLVQNTEFATSWVKAVAKIIVK